ncbi:MAG: hypothetical protein HPAVJP_5470 [Candidatus Hepatoplasma vulgare]|nr:MAG: hypothetical protein HPAVJP_5470 [Candidatus Hepatoplasma sp.]
MEPKIDLPEEIENKETNPWKSDGLNIRYQILAPNKAIITPNPIRIKKSNLSYFFFLHS